MHQETVRIVDAQMEDMSKQMGALDDFVATARSHNGRFHEAQLSSLDNLATNGGNSRAVIQDQLDSLEEQSPKIRSKAAVANNDVPVQENFLDSPNTAEIRRGEKLVKAFDRTVSAEGHLDPFVPYRLLPGRLTNVVSNFSNSTTVLACFACLNTVVAELLSGGRGVTQGEKAYLRSNGFNFVLENCSLKS